MKLIQTLFGETPKDGLEPVRAALTEAEVAQDAEPWMRVAHLPVGGLLAVGFERKSETLLVTSQSGQSVIDATTGTRLYRNRADDGFDLGALKATRLDHPASERIDMAGQAGGSLCKQTEDGWSVDQLAPFWPESCCVLQPPGASIYHLKEGWTRGVKNAEYHLLGRVRDNVRAFGFSWTGRSLVLATPSDLTIWARSAPLRLM